MSFMKKGAREASRKVKKQVQEGMTKYLGMFEKFSEIAYKLASTQDDVTTDNINQKVTNLGYEPLDDMGTLLVIGEYTRLRDEIFKQIELHTNEQQD